ncbi:NUDIX domain-containing protein [Candidatus Saccharibacteria bacterium]|nr:NUDIX domain-containing protein [Candidatus Saccharibacteria bacterium]
MQDIIKIGIGVMLLDDDKILLGHRAANKKDTGGIYETDCWTLPGGKQEYDETFFEGAKREVKEETNLDIDKLELFGAADDIQPDRHYITMHVIAREFSGKLKVMEPGSEDEWRWFSLDKLPDNLYSPSEKFIKAYLESKKA